jgi:ribonuclease Z
MKLTFLGTGAGNFRGDRRHMSSAHFDRILLDCGAGATGRLHDAELIDQVDGVLISHLHVDHFAGLFDFLLHTILAERHRALTIVSPPGLSPILRAMNDVRAMVKDPATSYDLRVVEGLRPELTIGRWKVRGVPLDHTVYDLGYLLTSDDATLFYTGDTRQPAIPEELRADFVVHESTYSDRDAELAQRFGHSTASQAARTATALHARRLFLTHIGDRAGSDVEIFREARAGFDDSTLAEDGMHLDL